MSLRFPFVLLVALPLLLSAAEPEPSFERGWDLVRTELKVAATGVRALSVAAHPDDEDGGTLSYLRRELGVETHICLATRGEGGQNEVGPELGTDLAVVRTCETETAAKILGAKVWHLNLPDFGYTKSIEETMEKWGHDVALERLVRVIRTVRPHILFTNHDENRTDHGHHRALAKLILEAFDAAADPAKFPEQIEKDELAAWKIQKLYIRAFAPPGATLTLQISKPDALTGVSPSDVAALALSKHFSQGMSLSLKLGEHDFRWFTRIKPAPDAEAKDASMIEGVGVNSGVAPVLAQLILANNLGHLGVPASPRKLVTDACVEQAALAIPNDPRLPHLHQALTESLGLKMEVTPDDGITTYDESVSITLRLANTGDESIRLLGWELLPESEFWEVSNGEAEDALRPGTSVEFKGTVKAKPGAYPTWPHAAYIFGRIDAAPPIRAAVRVSFGGAVWKITRPVPLELAMPREIRISSQPVLIFDDPSHGDTHEFLTKFRLVFTNHRKLPEPLVLGASTQTSSSAPNTWEALKIQSEEETAATDLRYWAKVEALNKGDVEVPTALWTAETNIKGPVAKLRRVPLTLPPRLDVGLIKTLDDNAWAALKQFESAGFGVTTTLLSDHDLYNADLNRFHTILLDLRATQQRPIVRKARGRLLKFMNNGGNVVCLGHKDFDWNTEKQEARGRGFFRGDGGGGEIAPFPIELSFARVTKEDAPVRILKPDHPLLLEPNKIWERDFADWTQERGTYFPSAWAKEYTALLSSNDPGEKPLDGGLLVANVGAGSFIYTSFALYRQLHAGNPGAYRLFANLISYSRSQRK